MSDSQNKDDTHGNDDGNNRRRQVSRSEHEWREILKRANKETNRFLKLYEDSFLLPEEEQENGDRLDRCAVAMGWHLSEDENEQDSSDEIPLDKSALDDSDAGTPEFPPVYSLHNLPESIAIAALFQFVRKRHSKLSDKRTFPTSITTVMERMLGDAYRDMFLAIDAGDALEFGLSICLMKNAHYALNEYLQGLNYLLGGKTYPRLKRKIVCAVLDLRDMCLRIMRDARIEMERAGKK